MSHGRTVQSPLGQIVRAAMLESPPQVVSQAKRDPRLLRETAAATLSGGAASFAFRSIPTGRFARFYRVVIGGTGIAGATVALYTGGQVDSNLLDWSTVPPAGLGAVFAPSSRTAYEIDPGSHLFVVVTNAGTGEVTGNAYYELLTWDAAGERLPRHESPATAPPDHQTGPVDFYPRETDVNQREHGNPYAPGTAAGAPGWRYPGDLATVEDEIAVATDAPVIPGGGE